MSDDPIQLMRNEPRPVLPPLPEDVVPAEPAPADDAPSDGSSEPR
jgi:hypothetical protein